MIFFEWDDEKERRNIVKHGVNFQLASTVFEDDCRITEEDSVVDGEQRWRTIGRVANGVRVMLVVHLEEGSDGTLFVRIISARTAKRHERVKYDESDPSKVR